MATVHVAGNKQVTDPFAAIRRVIKLREAERFYREELGRQKTTFDCVHWDRLEDALSSKGDPFRLWPAKQVSGFCGTQKMVLHWDTTRNG